MNTYDGTEPFVFVSYSHQDTDTVVPILQALDRCGLRIWYDEGIYSGAEWAEKIEQRLTDCDRMLAFISEGSIESYNCRNEIIFALNAEKPLHLVRLDDTPYAHGLGYQLASRNYLWYGGNAEALVEALMRGDALGPCKDQRRDAQAHSFWRPSSRFFGMWQTKEEREAEERRLDEPWGPERPTYREGEYPGRWALNSRVDHPTLGDERRFVTIRKVGTERWLREVFLEPGARYEVRMTYHVDGDPSKNRTGEAIANGVMASVYAPEYVFPHHGGTVRCALHANWPQPGPLAPDDEIWASVRLYVHDAPVFLSFVPASAKIHNGGYRLDGKVLATRLFDSRGVTLGVNRLTGQIPSGDDFGGSITFQMDARAHQGDCTIERSASVGDGSFETGLATARPGQTVTFRTTFENVTDAELGRVCFKDKLPRPLAPVAGTTQLLNGANPQGVVMRDCIDGRGISTGTYLSHANATVTYQVQAPEEARPHNYLTQSNVYHDGGRRFSNLLLHVEGAEAEDPLLVADPEHDPRYQDFLAAVPRGGWGPAREMYTMKRPAGHAAINSISDNNVLGDERSFVRVARRGSGDTYTTRLQVVPGYLYEVYVFYDNAAAPNLGEAGVVRGARVSCSFPSRIGELEWKYASATISTCNAEPPAVWGQCALWAAQPVVLRAVPGSARLYNRFHKGLVLKDTELFSREGSLLGMSALDGVLPCNDVDASGHIIFLLSCEEG